MISEWCDPSQYLKKGINDVTPEFMDAGIGLMNRMLQMLMDHIAEELGSLGAFAKGSLGKVCTEYSDKGDFYSSLLGIQVKVYLAGTGADSTDGTSLGQIVRNRNHFLYKYPKILKNSSGNVPPNEFQLLRDTMSAILRREECFDKTFQQLKKIQDTAQMLAGGKNNHRAQGANLEKVRRCIDETIPKDRSMVTVTQLNNRLRTVLPGMDYQKVLGMKLKDYLAGCKEYYLKETNSGLKVGRL